MLLSEIVALLGCTELLAFDEAGDPAIAGCFAADLMSEVLAFCGHGSLLVTGLTNVQSVQTAEIVDARAILWVNGKRPEAPVVALARARRLPLLSTALTMYEACGRLHRGGLPASRKEPAPAP